MTYKRVLSTIGPEGLLFGLAAALALWNHAERAAADLIGVAPYAVGLTGFALAWRLRRSRLVFALLILGLAFGLVTRWTPRHPTVLQLVALLVPLNLAAVALLPERGVFTRAGLWQSAALLLEGAAAALIARGAGAGSVWPPLAYPFLPRALSMWTRLDQPALLAFVVSAGGLGTGRWLARGTTGRGYLWALAAVFLALHARDAGLDRSLYFAAAGGVLVTAAIELSYVLAYQDGLTGLPARRALTEALQRLGGTYAVAMADVDHFKRFNDTYGHEVGDEVLRAVATRLKESLPAGRVFRYGGEEFAVLFPGKSADDCLPLLQRARETVAAHPFTVRRRVRPRKKPARATARRSQPRETITVSVGLAQPSRRHATPEEVVGAADQALYRAKQNGRNRVET